VSERDDAPEAAPESGEKRSGNPSASDMRVESRTFARCATCKHACEIDVDRGALLCRRFEMCVDAEADEIPDDCLEFRRDPEKPLPPGVEPYGAEADEEDAGG
jgi:hypothetical protein